jgi:hypothetical protein
MLLKVRSRLSYANVMATIAVFIALGGTSYAVATGSIGSREIKNNGVRGKDIRNNDVRGKDIRTGTIRSSDVGNSSLLAADFAPGQLPQGEKGDTGPAGPSLVRAFSNSGDIGLLLTTGGELDTIVGAIGDLSAGAYVFQGKAEVEPNPLGGSDTAVAICALEVNGVELDRSRLQIGENMATLPVTLRGTIPVQATANVAAGSTVALTCGYGGTNIVVKASQRSLTAIKVGSLQP